MLMDVPHREGLVSSVWLHHVEQTAAELKPQPPLPKVSHSALGGKATREHNTSHNVDSARPGQSNTGPVRAYCNLFPPGGVSCTAGSPALQQPPHFLSHLLCAASAKPRLGTASETHGCAVGVRLLGTGQIFTSTAMSCSSWLLPAWNTLSQSLPCGLKRQQACNHKTGRQMLFAHDTTSWTSPNAHRNKLCTYLR